MANQHKSRCSDAALPRAGDELSLGWPALKGGGNQAMTKMVFRCVSHEPASIAERKHVGTTLWKAAQWNLAQACQDRQCTSKQVLQTLLLKTPWVVCFFSEVKARVSSPCQSLRRRVQTPERIHSCYQSRPATHVTRVLQECCLGRNKKLIRYHNTIRRTQYST